MSWKRLDRKTIYDTKFVQIFEDTVELPNGRVFDDYSVIKFPAGVVIVATDKNDRLLLFKEYKYALDERIYSLPAGGIEGDQTPIEAAIRELQEETGYTSDEAEIVGQSHDYPSKIQSVDYIVRVKNAHKVQDIAHEATEDIGELQLLSLDEVNVLWKEGKIKGSYMIAALAHTFPQALIKD